MKNHYFDEDGMYTGSAPANPGTIAPQNALRIAPEQQDGFWPVLNAEKTGWNLICDHRGKQGWVDGHSAVITEIGPLPENWTDNAPDCEEIPETTEAQRRQAYAIRTDRIRDRALSYKLEAEACKLQGDAAGSRHATIKYNQELKTYLEEKSAIRQEYPDESGSDGGTSRANNFSAFFLGSSGVCHTAACGFAKGNGEWLERDELQARGDAVRPCRRCRPVIGE